MKKALRQKWEKLKFVYSLLGGLKYMFWICLGFFAIQALWEVAVLSSLATFFDGVLTSTIPTTETGKESGILTYFSEYTKGIPEKNRPLIGFGLAAGTLVIKSLIRIGISTFQTKLSTLFIYQVRVEVFKKLSTCAISYFDNNQKGSLIQMVINETRSCYTLLKVLLNVVTEVMMATVYISLMMWISYELSFVIIAICALFVIENYIAGKFVKKYSGIYFKEYRQLTSATDEGVGSAKQIKLLGCRESIQERFSKASWKADFANRTTGLIIEWQTTISAILAMVSFLGVLYFNFSNKILSVSALLSFLYLVRGLFTSLTGINQKYGMLNSAIPAVNNIFDFYRVSEENKESSGSLSPTTLFEEKISIENVSLDYGGGYVLSDVNLQIKKGENIALVGESGAGKTSLINLLTKLYQVTNGKILIDSNEINEFNLEYLREKIAVVNQDVNLFNCSVMDNLRLAKPNASDEEVINAAKDAYAHQFISELPEGYDTIIGDRGVKLSGGQRQRLNIAQVFLKDSEVVIFDEATSALDTKSEVFIQKAIEKLEDEKTCIIIAHRLSTVKSVDKIIVMEKGRIIEDGSWNDLVNTKGKFHEMLEHQSFN